MPLHFTGLISRHALDHPDESRSVPSVAFERVLKWNEAQHPRDKSGQFASSGGGGEESRQNIPKPGDPNYFGDFHDTGFTEAYPEKPGTFKPRTTSGGENPSPKPKVPGPGDPGYFGDFHDTGFMDKPKPDTFIPRKPTNFPGPKAEAPDFSDFYGDFPSKHASSLSQAQAKAALGKEPVTGFFKQLRKSRLAEGKHPGSMHPSGKPTKRSTFS